MKKVLIGLIAFFSMFNVVLLTDVSAKKTTKNDTKETEPVLVSPNETEENKEDIALAPDSKRVKVYIFGAKDCTWCEKEKEYLKGLASYGKKFEIVEKELLVISTQQRGEDYELGEKVANEFFSKGFTKASVNGTPFVIISDIYATTGYNTNLETIIDKAYDEGDKDAVSCIANNGKKCVRSKTKITETIVVVTVLVVLVGGIAGLVIYSRKQ